MMYLRTWIVDGGVAHCHCSDTPITHDVISVDGASHIITAVINQDYTDAGAVVGILVWDGSALSGLDFVSQEAMTL